jgi:hypothetical protein
MNYFIVIYCCFFLGKLQKLNRIHSRLQNITRAYIESPYNNIMNANYPAVSKNPVNDSIQGMDERNVTDTDTDNGVDIDLLYNITTFIKTRELMTHLQNPFISQNDKLKAIENNQHLFNNSKSKYDVDMFAGGLLADW